MVQSKHSIHIVFLPFIFSFKALHDLPSAILSPQHHLLCPLCFRHISDRLLLKHTKHNPISRSLCSAFRDLHGSFSQSIQISCSHTGTSEQPIWKGRALPPAKLHYIPLFCSRLSSTCHSLTYYRVDLFIINTPHHNMNFMKAGTWICSLKVFRNYLAQTLTQLISG